MIKVLIVDDDDVDTLTEVIDPNDEFDVATAKSVDEAITLIKNNPFDIAIIDMVMPNPHGKDCEAGLYIIDEVNRANHNIEIIVLTAFKSTENIVASTGRSIFSYIEKTPQAWEHLKTKIREAFEHKRTGSASCQGQSIMDDTPKKIVYDFKTPSDVLPRIAELPKKVSKNS